MWLCSNDMHQLWKYTSAKAPFLFLLPKSKGLTLFSSPFLIYLVWQWIFSTVDSALLLHLWLIDMFPFTPLPKERVLWKSQTPHQGGSLGGVPGWSMLSLSLRVSKIYSTSLFLADEVWWIKCFLSGSQSCHSRPVQVEAWEKPHLWLEPLWWPQALNQALTSAVHSCRLCASRAVS